MAAVERGVLPVEVLLELDKIVAAILRQWHDASRLPDLRRTLALTEEISPSAACAILRCSPLLQELRIVLGSGSSTNALLRTAAAHNPKLRVLAICGDVSDIGLEVVAQCDQLRALSISNMRQVTDGGVVHLARLRHLEKLEMEEARSVTPAGWRRLFSTCEWRHLRELSFTFYHPDEDDRSQLQLERLHSKLFSIELCGPVSDVDLEAVSQCDQLRSLSLRLSNLVTDGGVVYLARLCRLEKLKLSGSNSVTPAGWRRLLSTCEWPHLRQLSLTLHQTARDLPQLQLERLHSNLRSIELDGCVSDVDLAAIALCSQLRTLTLHNTSDVCDRGLIHLARLSHLEKLKIDKACRVTPAGWRCLFLLCKWPHLRELCLWMNYAATENPQVLFERFPATLHSIELRGRVSDVGLVAFAQCVQLRSLTLHNASQVTDRGVLHLARLSHLEKLKLQRAKRVTPDGWRRLFSTCGWWHLRELSLWLNCADRLKPQVPFHLLTSLRCVELNGRVSDIDLAAVAQCDQLRSLSIRLSNRVTDDGVMHLARLGHLENLKLCGSNSVTPAGWRRLFSVCEWRYLRELHLPLNDGVDIDDDSEGDVDDLCRQAALLCPDFTIC